MKTRVTRLVLLLVIAFVAIGPAQAAPSTQLEFLGQQIFPTATQFRGTTFGGLSSITYDARRNLFYALSDDQVNARFYTLRIGVGGGAPAVQIVAVTTLRDADGQPFAPASLDPEGLTLTDDRTLVVTSEGFANRLIDPWVREFDLSGHQLRALFVPPAFLPNAAGTHGVRLNLGFESAAVTPSANFLFVGAEAAVVQDGPPATVGAGSPARIIRYDIQGSGLVPRRVVDRQFVYWTDPIAEPPVPANQFAVNGLVELLPLDDDSLISMERSFSVGAPDTGNTIKLYDVSLAGADDVNGFDSIALLLGSIDAVQKSLLLDLDELGIPLDNVEGMTFGPNLPDGRRSLILVSDNNFSPAAFTQFLLFAAS
jgi:hypothetical protein